MLVEARILIDSFHSMIRKKIADDLEPWMIFASKSLVASSSGIIRDRAAVRAAITEPWWSNEQTRSDHEAQFGETADVRSWRFDLLQARSLDHRGRVRPKFGRRLGGSFGNDDVIAVVAPLNENSVDGSSRQQSNRGGRGEAMSDWICLRKKPASAWSTILEKRCSREKRSPIRER